MHYNKDIFTILKTWFVKSGIIGRVRVTVPCIISRNIFENAVQEHQRVVYDQVDIAAALGTSRTAAQMTSRFRDIESNVEASFSHQQRGLGNFFRVSSGTRKLSDTLWFEKLQQR